MNIDRARFLLFASALASTAVSAGRAAPPAAAPAKTRCAVLAVAPRCQSAPDYCVSLAEQLEAKHPAQVPAFLACIESTAKAGTPPSEACKVADAKSIAAEKVRESASSSLETCRSDNRLPCTSTTESSAVTECRKKCIDAYTKKLGTKPTMDQIKVAAGELEKCNKPCDEKEKALGEKTEACLKTKCTKEAKALSDAEAAATAARPTEKCAGELDHACTAARNVSPTCRTKFAKFFPAGE